jgi:hypothetical protein
LGGTRIESEANPKINYLIVGMYFAIMGLKNPNLYFKLNCCPNIIFWQIKAKWVKLVFGARGVLLSYRLINSAKNNWEKITLLKKLFKS